MDTMTDSTLRELLAKRTAEARSRSGANASPPVHAVVEPIVLRDDERQRCEVWTRVMGYHRPVASFNIGKKGEHCERQFFREPA